ncbi:MAG: glycoside hydrolase family 97 N-terminal domain-containing protein [Dysgonamonadaceae bacterium]|jgi:alpha-glucosidase|nr:glycoside hydrolase family 97 N-terminal domain-containing protein [Dysgonamonadaceae bacterium]
MMRILILSIVLPLFVVAQAFSQTNKLSSPDGKLRFELHEQQPQGELEYEINYDGLPVILPSPLGISNWEKDMMLEAVADTAVNTVWKTVYGERAEVKDHYNQRTFIFKSNERSSNRLQVIVRAYNEGIAFRYKYIGNNYLRITAEKTAFCVPENTYCWHAPFAQAIHTKMPVKDWKEEAERPLTLQLANGLYAALGEAAMVNYSRTKFYVRKGEENIIRCVMYDPVEEIAPFATPWRVVMVATQPKELLANNDLFLNLNQACEIANTSWIKPGKIMRVTQLNTEFAKKVVDFAVKRRLEYIHFDSGWYGREVEKESDPRKSIANCNMEEIVNYAKSKGIGVWLYVNQRALDEYLDEILPLYQSWGVAGIKFGFVHVGSFRWTTWLHEAVEKCARYNIMVDIHDEYRPTGFSRTFPNLLTQEGVRGNEEFPDGVNNTTLPFTRFLAGAADATVCYYHRSELKTTLPLNARSLKNTPCHQMALSVINYSPLQYLYWYDMPDDCQDEPELAFFDELYTVWDDTRVLEGSIGEYVSIARRKGDKWFVGSITNNDARKYEFAFDFLDPNKEYELRLFTDGGEKVKTRTHVAIQTKKVTSKSKIKLELLPRGGCAMIVSEMPGKTGNFDPNKALDYCVTQVEKSLPQLTDEHKIPNIILNDSPSKNWNCAGYSDWRSGFWPGILWYTYEYGHDENTRQQAERFSKALFPIAGRKVVSHDLGFQIYCSLGNGYRITGNPEYKEIMLRVADSLATLYHPVVGTICSWPYMKQWPHNTIIDNMMNLELLFWAAKNGGGKQLYDIAYRHAEVTRQNHFRNDFSTYHVVVYDTITGKKLQGKTHQGYADETMWARGQAWAIYGFTLAYRETKNKAFLETAIKAVDIFLKNLPEDAVPYWDFQAPDIPNAPRDASAAAIVASALLELQQYVKPTKKSTAYKDAAVKILNALSSENYQSRDTNNAFLLHSTGHKPNNSEVDAAIIYADYYYLEALLRLKKIKDGQDSI